jgi:hypothetical protein
MGALTAVSFLAALNLMPDASSAHTRTHWPWSSMHLLVDPVHMLSVSGNSSVNQPLSHRSVLHLLIKGTSCYHTWLPLHAACMPADAERTIHQQDRLMAQLQAQLQVQQGQAQAEGAGKGERVVSAPAAHHPKSQHGTQQGTEVFAVHRPASCQPQLPPQPASPQHTSAHKTRPRSAMLPAASSLGVFQHGMLFTDGTPSPSAQMAAGLGGALRTTTSGQGMSASAVGDAVAVVSAMGPVSPVKQNSIGGGPALSSGVMYSASPVKQHMTSGSPALDGGVTSSANPVASRVVVSPGVGASKPPTPVVRSSAGTTLGVGAGLLWEPDATPGQRHSSRPVSAVSASARFGSSVVSSSAVNPVQVITTAGNIARQSQSARPRTATATHQQPPVSSEAADGVLNRAVIVSAPGSSSVMMARPGNVTKHTVVLLSPTSPSAEAGVMSLAAATARAMHGSI